MLLRDEDSSGSVSLKEFKKAINALGFDAPKEEVESVYKQVGWKRFDRSLAAHNFFIHTSHHLSSHLPFTPPIHSSTRTARTAST